MKDPRITANELKIKHPSLLGEVAERTIQHRLQKDLNMPTFKAAHKPLLTRRMVNKGLQFAKKHKYWTVEDWRNILWSDESKFLCVKKRPGLIRRPRNSDRYSPLYTEKSVKHPDGVMVWGSFNGVGDCEGLHFLNRSETMNQDRYIQILEKHMLTIFQVQGCEIFMQDGTSCHVAKRVKKWLGEKKIKVLDWPENSPNLNPIENLWNIIKNRPATRNTSSAPRTPRTV